jgi:hypothetical protein
MALLSGDTPYVPVLLRSPLKSVPVIYSLKIKAKNGTSLLPGSDVLSPVGTVG